MSFRSTLPAGPLSKAADADVVLELAYLVTQVDGELRDAELAAFGLLAERVRGHAVEVAEVDAMIARYRQIAPTDVPERVRALGPRLPADLREPMFKLAMGLALVDAEGSSEEDDLVGVFVAALGLTNARAEELAEDVRKAFELN